MIVKAFMVVAALLLAAPATCMLIMSYESATRYDGAGADYRYIAAAARDKSAPRVIDLKRINGGDWQFICVIGAYNDPEKILREEAERRRIAIAGIDPVKTQFLGLAPVEENESAISFVDGAGRGRTVQLLAGQHARKCFEPDTGEIMLPLRVIE